MVIEITAMTQQSMVIFQFTNWGVGIPADSLEEIFKPFVRVPSLNQKKAIRGMGLGLHPFQGHFLRDLRALSSRRFVDTCG